MRLKLKLLNSCVINKPLLWFPRGLTLSNSTDGQNHTFMAVCLKETGDLIPVANLEQATYIDDRNNFVVSAGFTSEKDDDMARWEALNATTKKFSFDVKKLRRVGGRRAMNKALVTFI